MAKLWESLRGALRDDHDDDEKSLPYTRFRSRFQRRRSFQQSQLDQERKSEMILVNGLPYPKEVTIQPHTDDGGEPYYIGDAYEPAKCAEEWAISLYVQRHQFR